MGVQALGTDFHAVAERWVSITPLDVDLTGTRLLPEVEAWVDRFATWRHDVQAKAGDWRSRRLSWSSSGPRCPTRSTERRPVGPSSAARLRRGATGRSGRGRPSAGPRGPPSRGTTPVACSADDRAIRARTNPNAPQRLQTSVEIFPHFAELGVTRIAQPAHGKPRSFQVRPAVFHELLVKGGRPLRRPALAVQAGVDLQVDTSRAFGLLCGRGQRHGECGPSAPRSADQPVPRRLHRRGRQERRGQRAALTPGPRGG